MAEFKKGDRVRVKARTWPDYYDNHTIAWGENKGQLDEDVTIVHDPRVLPEDMPEIHWQRRKAKSETTAGLKCLFRRETDFEGIVIGWTFRKTGWREEGWGGDPPYFCPDKQHKVYQVIFAERERYDPPITCLAIDLELIDG